MYQNGICFVTDSTHTSVPVYEMVRAVLEAGIRFIQYREKEKTRRQLYADAMRLGELTRSYNAVFIVNDHADIALAVGADGVHLGQEDLPLDAARKIMGSRIIGISTHSMPQAVAAEAGGADYIGFGPVFHTTTKDAGSPKGVDIIRTIKQNVSIPVVAIGGIGIENVAAVVHAGADAVAVATAICKGDIAHNARMFVQMAARGFRDSRIPGLE